MTKHDKLYLGLLCLLLYFVGNNLLPVTDPVECNYALTAKEMLASGDYMSPRIYGNYWYDKPIFFYWELIAAFGTFGLNNFAARLFPAIFSTLGVFIIYFFASNAYGRRTGFVAGVLLLTSLEYWYVGHAIITDMTLFVMMSLSLIFFYLSWSEHKPLYLYPAFMAAGISVLTKGPLGLCLPGLIIILFLLWQRDLKYLLSLHMLGGFLAFFAVCAIWYLPMYKMHGQDFIDTFLGVHNYLRATVSEHPRDDVWYYYLLIFLAGFCPWSFASLPAIFRKLREFWQQRNIPLPKEPLTVFLAIWALTTFAVFQSFKTKYVTYTMPYMMPLAMLLAAHWSQREKLWKRIAIGSVPVYLLVLFLVASPMMYERSGMLQLDMLRPYLSNGTRQVYTYQLRPSASLGFYSDINVTKFITQGEYDEKHSQTGLSWSATNVWPERVMESIQPNESLLIITLENRVENMQRELHGSFEKLDAKSEFVLYRFTSN